MWYGNVAPDSFRIEFAACAVAECVDDGSDVGAVDDVRALRVCWSMPTVPPGPVRQYRIGRPPSAGWPRQLCPDSFSTSSGVE